MKMGILKVSHLKETRNRIEKVKYVEYYENGEKKKEATYKDGKMHGFANSWHENGQKRYEETYKDGELISGKCWDEDGNEKECN